MEKRMFRFFTVDDYEKEQRFLQDMTSKGWYFKAYKGFRYYFEKGEPDDYVYRIDYKEPLDDLNEYLSVFEDAGWEVVLQYPIFHGAWIYFRKPNHDENVEIFTSDESRLSLLKKIRTRWTTFGVSICALLLLILLVNLLISSLLITWLIPALCLTIILVLYGRAFVHLTRKIKHLEHG
ncbi:DUF2812 domain-containing protein [Listeria booriae]|uniref:DUF2812 domain-containing protein n=1 Tax=Listeria booriae TaxID=1552123 RepID=UPI0016255C7E|nr:DUF2812 domain-containing protein [Listeria booriae]MBC2327951.1 DUF2812 domain-containing protein [Listeria booriae]